MSREGAKGKAMFSTRLFPLFSMLGPGLVFLLCFASFASFAGLSRLAIASFRLNPAVESHAKVAKAAKANRGVEVWWTATGSPAG